MSRKLECYNCGLIREFKDEAVTCWQRTWFYDGNRKEDNLVKEMLCDACIQNQKVDFYSSDKN
ncbi:MAG: hypothetical protein ABEI78_01075 [Candidatus Nanohaloarchaea archaeon]